ncbi:MAG: LptA/OstA family protein [Myxococcota bacterium]
MSRTALAVALALVLAARGSRAQDAKPPEPNQPVPKSPGEAAERFGLTFQKGAELVITSDQAEGVKVPGGRQSVVFTKNVKAHQGDLFIQSDWLEAIYPEGSSGRPDKITARGAVVITQGANTAHCTDALLDNVACTSECRTQGGKAKLTRDTDEVEGDTIYFDMCKGTVKAVGSVQVRVREKQDTPGAPGAPGATTPGGAAAPVAPPQAPKASGG